jgi:hypothetical protein
MRTSLDGLARLIASAGKPSGECLWENNSPGLRIDETSSHLLVITNQRLSRKDWEFKEKVLLCHNPLKQLRTQPAS